MIDIFLREDMVKLLEKKSVVLMGDSNVRALYKDFLCLLRKTEFIPDRILKQKMESSCYGDKLVHHGARNNGRDYREERSAQINSTKLSFFFLTRVYDRYVKDVLAKIRKNGLPDILIINCCLWDVTRWGPSGVEEYKKNLRTLMAELKKLVPNCLVIWITAPPIACDLKGGFLLKELQFLKYSLRFHVVEANHYARKIVVENGFDVLDTHYHLKMQIHRRSPDGIHWFPPAVRYVTNLLLTHISLSWNKSLPHRYQSDIMEQNLETIMQDEIKIENSNIGCTKNAAKEVKSAIVQVSSTENIYPKNNKENCDTPKRKNRKADLPHHNKKTNVKQTHHAYLSRVKNKQRRKRIRQWQHLPAAAGSPQSFASYSGYSSPINSHYASPARFESYNDSGYFHSPNEVSFTSPSMNPDFSYHSPYTYGHPHRKVLRHTGYDSPYSPTQEPYVFPHPQDGQQLQPNIDFTSNDITFGGSYF